MKQLESKYFPALGSLILFVSISLLYISSLSYPHYYDTDLIFQNNFYASDITRFSLFELRSIGRLSFYLVSAFFNESLLAQRVLNVVLHAINCVVLFLFLRRLFQTVLGADDAKSINVCSFVAALLFGVSPVAVYAVAYVIQRYIILATFFGLLFLWTALEGGVRDRRSFWVWSAGFYFLAMHAKEHAVMLPAVVLLTFMLVGAFNFKTLKRSWFLWLTCLLVALQVIWQLKGVLGSVYESHAQFILSSLTVDQISKQTSELYFTSVLNQAFLFWQYLFLWLVPNPNWMAFDLQKSFPVSIMTYPCLVGGLTLILHPVWTGVLIKRKGALALLGWALLVPAILFLTELSAVRISENFLLYRSYLWMVGLFALVPFLNHLLGLKKFLVLSVSFVLVSIVVQQNRLATFSSPVALWADVVHKLPEDKAGLTTQFRPLDLYGQALLRDKKYKEALPYLKRAYELKPDYIFVHQNLAQIYEQLQEFKDARYHSLRAIQLRYKAEQMDAMKLDAADVLIRLARACFEYDQKDLALEYYDEAIRFNPESAQAYYELGQALYILKRYDEALLSFKKVLLINPINTKVYYNMALVAYRQGTYNFALEFLQRVPQGIPEFEKAQTLMKLIRESH